jgi:hypothetical protein
MKTISEMKRDRIPTVEKLLSEGNIPEIIQENRYGWFSCGPVRIGCVLSDGKWTVDKKRYRKVLK